MVFTRCICPFESRPMMIRVLALTAALVAPTLVQAEQSVRLRGTVDTVDGQAVTMTTTTGETAVAVMDDDYGVLVYRAIDVGDLGPGDFLSIPSIPGADGAKIALSINVFPEAMRGTGEGERPWDMRDGSQMTNATIGTVESRSDSNILNVSYDDVSEQVVVPDGAPITRFAPEEGRVLEPGDSAIIFATRRDDGTLTGAFAGVSADGTLPPV